jgi:predicted MFS family arabinose efflux permease
MQIHPATSEAPNGIQRYRVILAGISALILTVGLARFAYTPLLPVMRQEAGLSLLAGGWLATLNYAGYISGLLVASWIGGLQFKFQLYRASLVIAVVSTAAMGLTDNLYLWALLRFIAGFSSIAGLVLASGLILDWLNRQGHRPELGLHFSGLGLGIAASAVAVAAMSDLPWDWQWINLGLLGILFFVPAWFWLPRPEGEHVAAPGAAPVPSRRWLNLMAAAYFCAGFGYVISATFIVDILEALPLLAGRGGWIWLVVGAAAVPSTFVWDRVASRFGQIPGLLLAYALQTISIVLPLLTESAFLNLLGAGLWGATAVGIVSLSLSIVGRRFPANPTKAMARLTLSYGIAQIVAPAMAGYIASFTGSYRGSLAVAAAVMIAGMLLLMMVGGRKMAE